MLAPTNPVVAGGLQYGGGGGMGGFYMSGNSHNGALGGGYKSQSSSSDGYGAASNEFFYQLKPLSYGGMYDYNNDLYASSSNRPTTSSSEENHNADLAGQTIYASSTPSYSLIDSFTSSQQQQTQSQSEATTMTPIRDNSPKNNNPTHFRIAYDR